MEKLRAPPGAPKTETEIFEAVNDILIVLFEGLLFRNHLGLSSQLSGLDHGANNNLLRAGTAQWGRTRLVYMKPRVQLLTPQENK